MQTFHFCGRVALGAFELFKNRNELSSLNFCSEKSCCASSPSVSTSTGNAACYDSDSLRVSRPIQSPFNGIVHVIFLSVNGILFGVSQN